MTPLCSEARIHGRLGWKDRPFTLQQAQAAAAAVGVGRRHRRTETTPLPHRGAASANRPSGDPDQDPTYSWRDAAAATGPARQSGCHRPLLAHLLLLVSNLVNCSCARAEGWGRGRAVRQCGPQQHRLPRWSPCLQQTSRALTMACRGAAKPSPARRRALCSAPPQCLAELHTANAALPSSA